MSAELIAVYKDEQIIDLESAKVLGLSDGIKALKGSEPVFFDDSPLALEVIRHSCAHLLAQSLKALYPDAKFFVGPVVEEGFYYDFKTSSKISEEDLPKIEAKMKEFAKLKLAITKEVLTREQALERFKGDELKHAVMSKISGDIFGVYQQGEFEDLCKGPHLPNTRFLNHFKLTKLAGAYLGGDENNEMLIRIYGIAFATKESLKDYLFQIEEAKKRDHRKLGVELGLFSFDDEIGAGLPLWLPKGARLRKRIEDLLSQALLLRGYEPVKGPEILKSDVWKISGHYDNYKENMYFTTIDEQEYGIKPMNCVGHIKVYQSTLHSYRDLPLRFYEYGVVHRHEKSGVLHGLLRVREFTQDDAHIFCSFEQIQSEVSAILDFTHKIMKAFDFSYEMELSTRPTKSIGDDEVWEKATNALKEALKEHHINYKIDEGGGAFYGPKIDIKITDALRRKWQCGTIQVDMNLPERFKLAFTNERNHAEQPVMIHRAILGSFERFIAILSEHFGGNFPFFVAPTQIALIPINEEHHVFALKLKEELKKRDIFVEVLDKNDSLNKKVRLAEKQKIPMILVLGNEEMETEILSIRDREKQAQYKMPLKEFLNMVESKMQEVSF
ncbi:threonine--tRNA ligase [Helicobacter pylori]|uniref:threonine--tRNA ligase n=1 Tax=Helicobacter pylori TaxID=210 RepID=UPI0009923FFB|nr:threonine--tRNA ligase [Helicobacter pylori]OOP98678.1 threonine--tRNA ligase [Helicobacter pylori]PDW89975.1 threonine--tRNA ligase [Helicobacter pylori]WQU75497.1 threonine--tRNA ligase [Helicobacter pylori]